MGKSNTQQTSFTAGEVSPLLRGRPDIAKFQQGAETVENFVVRPQGPLWRRCGTQYIGRAFAHTAAGICRLERFEFSSTEAYLLEFGNQALKIRDQTGAAVLLATVHTISSVANNAGQAEVTTAAPHGMATSDFVTVADSTVPAYDGEWLITVTGATTFVLEGSFYSATATATARQHVVVVTPYPSAILSQLKFAQSADTMWITHKSYKPRTLTRTSSTSWAMAEFTTVDGPYLDYNKTDIRLKVTNLVDTATMVGNAAFVAAAPFSSPADVNDFIEFMDDGEFYLAQITAVTSTSVATVDIIDRVLVGIHPSVRLQPKANGGASSGTYVLPGARSGVDASRNTVPPRYSPLHPPYRVPRTAVPGVSPNTSPPHTYPEGIDPNTVMAATGGPPFTILTSTHANTFSYSDTGKYVRIAANDWRLISGITNHFTATLTTPAPVFKAYSYALGEEVTITQNSRTITATLTASAAAFASTDVGRHIRMNFQGRWVFAKISAYTSTTVVTIRMFESFPRHLRNAARLANDGNTDIWQLGAWYGDDGSGNYPSQVTFHEQRLVFAGSPLEPQTLWFSRPQDFNKMSPSEPDGTVTDDNAINVTLASNKVNAITWLQSSKVLLVGTIGGEWQGRAASSITEPISPTNIAFTEETTHGSVGDFQPLKIGSAVLFLQSSGQKLRELTYNFELDGWSSRDLTVASEHILRKGTKGLRMAFQNEPHSIIWVLTSAGDLVGMTYQREQEVVAWHYHRIGGSGIVESICSMPSSNGTEHTLFMAVRRTIGTAKRYIEKLTADDYPESASDKSGFCYVDSLVSQTMGSVGTTWTKFAHLAGQSVQVLKNGVLQGTTFTVNASGVITGLSYADGDVLTGGLAYTSKLKTLPFQGGSPYGSSDMTKKRVHKLILRVYNSINCKVGRSESELQTRIFSGTAGSELVHTGDVELTPNTEYGSDGVFHVQVSDPYPLILLGYVAQGHANE